MAPWFVLAAPYVATVVGAKQKYTAARRPELPHRLPPHAWPALRVSAPQPGEEVPPALHSGLDYTRRGFRLRRRCSRLK